jgi:predicted nucleic acid-binding protein
MRFVVDTDILSTFARIRRLDILKNISDGIVIPQAVKAELARGRIDVRYLDPDFVVLTKDELKYLKKTDHSLGLGERECFVIARNRRIPLASNETIVHRLCRRDGVDYLTLPRILRFAIIEDVITRQEAKKLINAIEKEEHTVIKNKNEIFK